MIRRLGELRKGQRGRIRSVAEKTIKIQSDEEKVTQAELARRLLEMGLLEGSLVEVVHEAPFSGDPLAVRVRGALIALRRNEANQIEVEVDE